MAPRTERAWMRLAALLPPLLLLWACQSPPLEERLSLAPIATTGDVTASWDLRTFGTPDRLFGTVGLLEAREPFDSDPFAWSRPRSWVSFAWAKPEPRTLILDLEPQADLGQMRFRVAVNDEPVKTLTLLPGRRRYSVALPAAPQRAGTNRIALAFGGRTERLRAYHGRISARIFALAAVPTRIAAAPKGEDASLPPLLSTSADGHDLLQTGPSSLSFAVELPEAAALEFSPTVVGESAASPIRFRVTIETRPGSAQRLWSAVVRPGAPQQTWRVHLPGPTGAPVRIGLSITPTTAGRMAWARWGQPRLLGRAGPSPSEPSSVRTDAVRHALGEVNVVFIILDAARSDHFGTYGYERRTTPEIDRLAAEGVVFDHAFTTAPFTLAAMSSIWSSRYPDQHGVMTKVGAQYRGVRFVLPEALQAAGIYTAAIVGSPVVGKAMGFDRGFTEHREIESETVSQAEQFRPILRTWLEEHAAQRFLLYIHFREPHAPYDPPAPYDTMFGPNGPAPRDAIDRLVRLAEVGSRKLRPAELAQAIRLYDGGLACVDHEVGILGREMERLGLLEKTVLVVAADHGEALTEHGHIGHNAQVYRESVQIPLIFRFPQRLRLAGMRVPDVVDLLDVAPTFAEIFGVDPPKPPDPPFLGSSLLDLLAGERRSKPLVARSAGSEPQYAWREDGWAYLLNTETGQEELFETGSDPDERVNRLETDPLRAALLRQALRRWKLVARPDASAGPETDLELTREQQNQLRLLGYLE